MNRGLSDELKTAFPDITPVVRPLVVDQEIKDPNWLAGFSFFFFCYFFIHIFSHCFPRRGKQREKNSSRTKKSAKKKVARGAS
jgi:hypothetical protein